MAIFSFANQYIPDPTRDAALAGGELYLGFPDTDPELPGNQFPVSAIQEDGTTVQIPQPVQINQGGVIVYNGSPVQITFTQNSYSTKVNKNGSQFYYIARTTVSEGVSISEWNTETEYFKDISIVRGSNGKGYYATDDSGPSSTPVDPVTDTDNSHWVQVGIITKVGDGPDDIPTNSQIKGLTEVGRIGYFARNDPPDGWFARDGSTIVNGVVLYPELAAIAATLVGIVTVSGNDLILDDFQHFDAGKGSSSTQVGTFTDGQVGEHAHAINSYVGDSSGGCTAGANPIPANPNNTTSTAIHNPGGKNTPDNTTVLACVYHGVFA